MTDVLQGVELTGAINTPPETILAQLAHSVRQGHPQLRQEQVKPEEVAIVGGGPSLDGTLDELRDLHFAGARVVALNGALRWLVDRNIRPSAAVVLDAREASARFLEPDVPRCVYYVASQCHPSAWEVVRDRQRVVIWHAVSEQQDDAERDMLDRYYGRKRWVGVVGGTTVATRAVTLLRISGYVRLHLFGVDCCWMGGAHHAYRQAENDGDSRRTIEVAPSRGGIKPRAFECAAWHLQQLQDFLQFIRLNGDQVMLAVHGDGLLAHVLRAGADVALTER